MIPPPTAAPAEHKMPTLVRLLLHRIDETVIKEKRTSTKPKSASSRACQLTKDVKTNPVMLTYQVKEERTVLPSPPNLLFFFSGSGGGGGPRA